MRAILAALLAQVLFAGVASSVDARQADSLLLDLPEAGELQALEDLLDESPEGVRAYLPRVSSTSALNLRDSAGPRARSRLDLSTGNWELRVVGARDPGEPWLDRSAAGVPAPGHVGSYLTWRPGDVLRILIGDFRLDHGIGLAAAQPAFGKPVDDPFARSRTGPTAGAGDPIRAYAGSDERRYHSGAAATLRTPILAASLFASTARSAGVSTKGVVLGSGGAFFNVSGLVLEERSRAVTAFPSRTPADSFRVRLTVSIGAKARTGAVRWALEAARVGDRRAAAAYARMRGRRLDFLVGWRRTEPGFSPRWASPPSFRGGHPGNESGIQAALQRHTRIGPHRLAWDRGCRIRAEDEHPRGGCTDALRADGRWLPGEGELTVRLSHDRLREADSAERRGSITGRTTITAALTFPLAYDVSATLSIAARSVDSASSHSRSSRTSLRVAWSPREAWRFLVGTSDVHAEQFPMSIYEPGLPLAGSLRTVGGDETSLFASATRTGRRISGGLSCSARQHLPGTPGPGTRVQKRFALSFYAAVSVGPIERP